MKRVSFDVDGVLTEGKGRRLAQKRVMSGDDVWIVTARTQSDDDSAYKIAERLGISKSHVVFTNGKDKWKFIQKYRIAVHYDNNKEQLDKIERNTKAIGVMFR